MRPWGQHYPTTHHLGEVNSPPETMGKAVETPKPTHAETLDVSDRYKGKVSKSINDISACRTFAASIDKEREN
jgi:hypothetical protein